MARKLAEAAGFVVTDADTAHPPVWNCYCEECCAHYQRRSGLKVSPAPTARPVNHGTSGGYQAEARRGLAHCASCLRAHRAAEADRIARARRGRIGGESSETETETEAETMQL